MTEQDYFLAAREQPDPAARAAFLSEACAGNTILLRQLERLLRADTTPHTFLDSPAVVQLETGEQTSPSVPPTNDTDLSFLAPATRAESLGRLGHYDVLELLGKGGFGIVFRAFDEVLHRVVAVKVLAPPLAAMASARKRFLREARSAAQVRHDNVVQIHGVEEQPCPYLVMEYIPGETLQQRIDRLGPLETSAVIGLGRQVAAGLAAAHATGLIHRDVKPANVLIERGSPERVKLTDFGLARLTETAEESQSGYIAGTPSYMSPEQVRGEHLDQRSDLFSLGSVLYAMTTGRSPFRASNTLAVMKRVNDDVPRPIVEIVPTAPQWLCDLIARLHAKSPQDRLASAQEVVDRLALGEPGASATGGLGEPGASATGVFATPVADAPGSPRRMRRVVAAIFLLLFVGVAILQQFTSKKSPTVPTADPDVKTVAPPVQVENEPDPDRRAALWLRSLGPMRMEIITHGPIEVIEPHQPVPTTPFRLHSVNFRNDGIHKLGDDLAETAAPHLKGVRLFGAHLPRSPTFTTAGLARLVALPAFAEVTFLSLDRCGVDDGMFAHLSKLPRLATLDATRLAHVTGKGFLALKGCPNLVALNLIEMPLTAEAMEEFQQLPRLQSLNLTSVRCTEKHVAALARLKITSLHLANAGIDDSLAARLTELEKLESLSLLRNPLTDRGLAAFKKCKGLKHLMVGVTEVTATGVADLRKALPDCKVEWD